LIPQVLAAQAALWLGGAWAAGADADQPVKIEARAISGTVDEEARAEGDVELRRGGLLVKADRLTYRIPSDRAIAEGRVVVNNEGSTFRGPRLELQVESLEGFFLQPDFDLTRTKTAGRAQRIDFFGSSRFQATQPIPVARWTALEARTGCCRRASSLSTSMPTKAWPKAPGCISWGCRCWRCRG
jgi:lipopolysaccharide assembly outer membrane protein LptD (OstA)